MLLLVYMLHYVKRSMMIRRFEANVSYSKLKHKSLMTTKSGKFLSVPLATTMGRQYEIRYATDVSIYSR